MIKSIKRAVQQIDEFKLDHIEIRISFVQGDINIVNNRKYLSNRVFN